jgi:hypothetical protein
VSDRRVARLQIDLRESSEKAAGLRGLRPALQIVAHHLKWIRLLFS